MAAMVVVGLAGAGFACLSTAVMQNYGWGLFVALPFAMGLTSVLIYAGPRKRSLGSCLAVSIRPVIFVAIFLLFAAV